LENLLVLVPFILISQAALIDQRVVWVLCVLGGILAAARLGSLKKFMGQFDLPPRLVWLGLVVLLVNGALPAVYRVLHEYKFGTKPTWGAAYHTNQWVWLALLPVLCGLANLLPGARQTGGWLPQRRWLPLGLFSLWIAGTTVHLYCLGYVYDFSLRLELVAPAIWMVLWTVCRCAGDYVPQFVSRCKQGLLLFPALATLAAISPGGSRVFVVLTVANAVIYGGIYLRHRDRGFALHLLLLSLVALVAGMPESWGHGLAPQFDRAKWTAAGTAAYCLLWAVLGRNPKLGILGSIVSATAIAFMLNGDSNAFHWAGQVGLAFLLLHSLRWSDSVRDGANVVRILAGLLWIGQSLWWLQDGGRPWMTCTVAATVLSVYLAVRLFGRIWGPWVVPIAAILVLLSGPGDFTAGRLQTASVGLLAVVGSFVLFGLGTLAALTKHHWNKN
jgi:hypothetical protein